MSLSQHFELLRSFSPRLANQFGRSAGSDVVRQLELEGGGRKLPPEFAEYVARYAPVQALEIDQVGNPLSVYPSDGLSWKMEGYNFNPLQNRPLDGWDDTWFLFADIGADPIIVKLDEYQDQSRVYMAYHGMGKWEFNPVADSMGQFFLCAAAIEYSLLAFGPDEPAIDNENGFQLSPKAADWLFPFIKLHAQEYYEQWLDCFDNR